MDGAAAFLDGHSELANRTGYAAHPWLRWFVERNGGHCYKRPHLQIADYLTPEIVRDFRRAVLEDRIGEVRRFLRDDAALVPAEFTAGRGIAQAIHHWSSPDVARLLVDAGADLEALTTLGETPLSMQQRFGTLDGVRFLLERGADPNHGVSGCIPSRQMSAVIELLLDYGWDINKGQMVLHDANHGHGKRVVNWLKYGADPNAADRSGQTALHIFARRGSGRDAIRALVKAGANLNARDREGKTPLDVARTAGSKAVAQQLIALGADGATHKTH